MPISYKEYTVKNSVTSLLRSGMYMSLVECPAELVDDLHFAMERVLGVILGTKLLSHTINV